MVVICFNPLFIYLRTDLTVQMPITELARVIKREKREETDKIRTKKQQTGQFT
jgi:hypothetical protein